ncbi:MAG TPA: hypothetical protein VFA96_10100, partial [Nocardioides sp.]|nr:hypothetical protein [Nocardioides sp.]
PAAKDPYFLYGASNLGSMLALLAYPFLIEPFTTISNAAVFAPTELGERLSQPWIWTIGYFVLLVLVLACAGLVWNPAGVKVPHLGAAAPVEPELAAARAGAAGITDTATRRGRPGTGGGSSLPDEPDVGVRRGAAEELTWGRRLRWVLLAAVPSSLMLGVTTFITTDLTPMPMFWLIPLTLYLASFIFVFARWPVVWVETPHRVMLWAQPIGIALMLLFGYLFGINHASYLRLSIGFYVLGFFLTTMVCHGELAKDRPSTRFLTEFYLWMSVGGMCGGIFNGLVAPVVFYWGIAEFGIAVFAACLLRPKMGEGGWLDGVIASALGTSAEPAPVPHRGKGQPRPAPAVKPAVNDESISRTLDVVFPIAVLALSIVLYVFYGNQMARGHTQSAREYALFIIFGIPLLLSCIFLTRPLRFALAITAVMLVHWTVTEGIFTQSSRSRIVHQTRSYFGHIVVRETREPTRIGGEDVELVTRSLTHGTTHHGMNYQLPERKKDWGDPQKDLSRLATTYYNRYGPVGRVMEMKHFNYFPGGPQNVFHADARMPCSQVGAVAASLGVGNLPYANLVDLWSEPPIATVGLGTGTMASYGRPFQHVHFYEIDNQIRKLSLPEEGDPYFNYLRQAEKRGCDVQVLMGDARLRMRLPYRNFHTDKAYGPDADKVSKAEPPGGPEKFYQMMVVDAFSSDAIPAHLLTLEALEMYF